MSLTEARVLYASVQCLVNRKKKEKKSAPFEPKAEIIATTIRFTTLCSLNKVKSRQKNI